MLIAQPDTDDAIADLERETDKLHLAVERLDRLEGPLFERLDALRSEARREQWSQLRSRYIEAAHGYLAALEALLPHLDSMGAVAGAMFSSNFPAEAHARPPVPWAGTPLAVEQYRVALRRFAELGVFVPRSGPPPLTREQWHGAFGVGPVEPLEEAARGGRHVKPEAGECS